MGAGRRDAGKRTITTHVEESGVFEVLVDLVDPVLQQGRVVGDGEEQEGDLVLEVVQVLELPFTSHHHHIRIWWG